MQFTSPLTDFGFFRVFGNENAPELLISFLNAVLGLRNAHKIETVRLLEPFQAPKIATLRHNVMDVECRNRGGVEFLVEIQISYTEAFQRRGTYNPATEVEIEPLASALNFLKPRQVFGISILDFAMFPDFEHYFWHYDYREAHENYCDEIRHYFIEAPKFNLNEGELQTDLEKWGFFLKHAGELEAVPARLDSGLFRKAFALANRANMTSEEWEAYFRTCMWVQDKRGAITAAYKQGYERGLIMSRAELDRAFMLATFRKSLDTRFIAKVTELSLPDTEALDRLN